MEALTLDRVMDLARARDGARLSLYMPTSRFGPDSQDADSKRLKRHLRTAEEQLIVSGLKPAEAVRMLTPARALIEDRPFWLRSREGLAIFVGPEGLQAFQLPKAVPESVRVNERYHVKPLVAFLGTIRDFWLLALSQKHVRLYHGTRDGFDEVPAENIPTSLADAMRWEDYEKSSLQFHTGTTGQGGRRPAVFHGTGESDVKDEIVRYFRGIDRGIHELLKDSEAPLVLAGVEYLLPIYREVNTYPHLQGIGLPGSPEATNVTALHERAWQVVSALADAERASAASRVTEAWASPRTTPDPASIVAAAAHGRIEVLLVSEDAEWWGSYESDAGEVIRHAQPGPGDEDLLDLATLNTLLNGGDVYSLPASEMPKAEDAVALLRY